VNGLPHGLAPGPRSPNRRSSRRRFAAGVLLSGGAHLAFILGLVIVRPTEVELEPPPVFVELVQLPPPEPPKPPPPKAPTPKPEVTPIKPPPPRAVFRKSPRPPPPEVETVQAGEGPSAEGVEMSDAALAGAATAGSGDTSGSCNMLRRLEAALRRDPMVRSAMAEAHRGKAIRVWNGDWVRYPGQDGHGLAAVREAIMWEVGFAPAECRTQRVRGLVVISLNDGAGRLVVGSGDWRWSDLLFARGAGAR